MPEHIASPDPTVTSTTITDTGALSCSSGSRTGRVPKDKRIVLDEETKDVSSFNKVTHFSLESSLGRSEHPNEPRLFPDE